MPENRGYYDKFNVSRKDGRDLLGGDRFGANYFTLDLTHDPYAKVAALAYADACEKELPLLAKDLRDHFGQ